MQKLALRIGWHRLLLVGSVAALLGLMVSATSADEPQFSAWSAPVNLGPIVNSWGDWTTSYDACPTVSKDGLSLYFRSNRLGGYGAFDIWVAQRHSVEDPWGTPVNLGPKINGPAGEFCTAFSPDGHWMVFVSNRPVSAGGCGNQDLWISHRKNKRDDFGWQTPRNLGCTVNSPAAENGPAWYEDEATGRTLLYYSSGRPGGLGFLDIYVSEAVGDAKGNFGPPTPVAELNTSDYDYQPVLSKDGLEVIFASDRPDGSGLVDLWTSTRADTLDPWSPPVNLGPGVNSIENDFHPTLSFDRTTLIFASERGGPTVGWADLWMCTRTKLRDPD
jgi:Tol biopolymer transport system component